MIVIDFDLLRKTRVIQFDNLAIRDSVREDNSRIDRKLSHRFSSNVSFSSERLIALRFKLFVPKLFRLAYTQTDTAGLDSAATAQNSSSTQ